MTRRNTSTVPKEVADRLRRPAGDGEAGVTDPSWSVLATLLEEEQFLPGPASLRV